MREKLYRIDHCRFQPGEPVQRAVTSDSAGSASPFDQQPVSSSSPCPVCPKTVMSLAVLPRYRVSTWCADGPRMRNSVERGTLTDDVGHFGQRCATTQRAAASSADLGTDWAHDSDQNMVRHYGRWLVPGQMPPPSPVSGSVDLTMPSGLCGRAGLSGSGKASRPHGLPASSSSGSDRSVPARLRR